jgi:tRNA threonylcarbamoyladenosine biosynthesis protein TsaB
VIVLAVESATDAVGVAIAGEDGVLASVSSTEGRRHAESLVPFVGAACERAGTTLDAVDALVVDVGPGLFTGLRVGVGTTKALAFALGLQVVTVTSLETLAHALARGDGEVPEGAARLLGTGASMVPVVDARRGEVFWSVFEPLHDVRPDGPARVSSPGQLARELSRMGPVVVAGDGARRYAAELSAAGEVAFAGDAFDHPPVTTLALVGHERANRGGAVDVERVSALYVREADVRINWQTRAGRPVPADAAGRAGPGAASGAGT